MMKKFNQQMTAGVGNKTVAFVGRTPFRIKDAAFEKALLSIGTFKKLKDGTLRYSGRITLIDLDGKEHKGNADGYLDVSKGRFKPEIIEAQFI